MVVKPRRDQCVRNVGVVGVEIRRRDNGMEAGEGTGRDKGGGGKGILNRYKYKYQRNSTIPMFL